MKKPVVVVIDGMGGGIGKSIVEKLYPEPITLLALGTNPTATKRMCDAGAHQGYTGEETIIPYVNQADILVGVMGILIPNGLSGEFTTELVTAICQSKAVKIMVPMNKCGMKVACAPKPLSDHIDQAVALVKEEIQNF